MEIDIKIITDRQTILDHVEMIQDIPFTNTLPEIVIGKCLTDDYCALLFEEDEKPVGICILQVAVPNCHIVGLHLKGKTKLFYNKFFSFLRKSGIKHITASSVHSEEYFKGFSGFKREYTVYSKDL